MSGLFGILLYNAPWLIAWYRRRKGKPILGTLGLIFMLDFFCGWTIVGWFLALSMALNVNVVAPVVLRISALLGNSGLGGNRPPSQGTPSSSGSSGMRACSSCNGSGSLTCSSCGGRGSWYDAPTTATGSAQLRNCGACTSSGRLRCTTCGGSGRMLN